MTNRECNPQKCKDCWMRKRANKMTEEFNKEYNEKEWIDFAKYKRNHKPLITPINCPNCGSMNISEGVSSMLARHIHPVYEYDWICSDCGHEW